MHTSKVYQDKITMHRSLHNLRKVKRFTLLGKHLGVQGPIFHRPRFFSKYNDGELKFLDLGPIRFYHFAWRD